MSQPIQCPHRPACDGCPAFEQEPAASFRDRVDQLSQDVARYALHPWAPAVPAPQGRTHAYRNRARMIVGPKGQLGLYRAGTRELIPITRCAVHEPAVEAVLAQVRAAGAGAARHVDVRANASGRAIVTFGFEFAPGEAEKAKLAGLANDQLSVHINVGGKQTFLSGEQICLAGSATLEMTVGSHSFDVPPTAFFQVNTEVLAQIHDVIRPWVAGETPLYDIHCGVGVHGIACAAAWQNVRGFDIDPTGVEAARQNAARSSVSATYEALADDAVEISGRCHVIVNPARAGLAATLPRKLGAADVTRIAYVSCDPRTFLRDAERLANEGFALRELHAFDMMPRTAHVELAGLFERTASQAHWQHLGDGVTGAAGDGADTWVALLSGSIPKRATLPGGVVGVERLRNVEGGAVVRLSAPTRLEHVELRKTLRHWSHPVIGDEQHGLRSANFRWRQDAAVDAPLLHRVRCGATYSPVPDFFLNVFQLPRHIVEASPR